MIRTRWLLVGSLAVSIVLLCISITLAATVGLPDFVSIAIDTVAGLLLGTGIYGLRQERRGVNHSE